MPLQRADLVQEQTYRMTGRPRGTDGTTTFTLLDMYPDNKGVYVLHGAIHEPPPAHRTIMYEFRGAFNYLGHDVQLEPLDEGNAPARVYALNTCITVILV